MMLNILLVDDNQTFLAAVRQFLNRLSATHVVAEAHDGREALNKAAEFRPDLMLLDVAMPHMNGLDVARTMQSWPQAPAIIFLSMHDNVAYREVAADLGARGFVSTTDFVVGLLPLIEKLVTEKNALEARL